MSHDLIRLQKALVSALRADAGLTALTASPAVFDAPPAGRAAPYVVIARHDVVPNDTDLMPGHDHRVILHLWAEGPSRRAVVAMAERVEAVARMLAAPDLTITLRRTERLDTALDPETGRARAALTLRFLTEPN